MWHRFGGKEMGYVGNNSTQDTDYIRSLKTRTVTPSAGAFRDGTYDMSQYADFDQSLERINSFEQGTAHRVTHTHCAA